VQRRNNCARAAGGLLALGDPETVAGELKKLAEAGFDGFCFSVVAYNDELPYFIQEVLPRLERLGLRQKVVF
jgi:FMNH2-dependent dimethyl sulfone monooxygenase